MKTKTYVHVLLAVIVVVVTLAVFETAYAAATLMPFGGRILNTVTPGITCAAQYGVINIQPLKASFPATPYIIIATKKTVTTGGWILGFYNTVMNASNCVTDAGTPYPTFPIGIFGASK